MSLSILVSLAAAGCCFIACISSLVSSTCSLCRRSMSSSCEGNCREMTLRASFIGDALGNGLGFGGVSEAGGGAVGAGAGVSAVCITCPVDDTGTGEGVGGVVILFVSFQIGF